MRTTRFLGRTLLPLAFALALTLAGCGKPAETETKEEKSGNGLTIGYAEGVIETDDPNALQKAFDEAVEAGRGKGIAVYYRPEAISDDGITFRGRIGNSTANVNDLFIAIYGDSDFTDELFVSQLLRPGTAFDEITLNHALPVGRNTVYTAFTTVVQEDGETKIDQQQVVTIDFIVHE